MTEGIIVKAASGGYSVMTEAGAYDCRARGIFRKDGGLTPLTGDRVAIDILDEASHEGNIIEIKPRVNSFVRPAVANIDQIVYVFAAASPAPDLMLLDKLSVAAFRGGVKRILCINKTDLVHEDSYSEFADAYRAAGFIVIITSCALGKGIDELRALLRGAVTVFAGQSGVGKSTLLNLLLGGSQMTTGTLSEKIQRGKHTTRHTEMLPLPGGGYVIDTPGFSVFEPEPAQNEAVCSYFPEFDAAKTPCRFSECVHINEPDCAVKELVKLGVIDKGRYERYIKIYEMLRQSARAEIVNSKRTVSARNRNPEETDKDDENSPLDTDM